MVHFVSKVFAFLGVFPPSLTTRLGLNYFNKLPEECVSAILSLTSPLDACRSSLVFSTFRSAMELDMVWDRFLPSDYSVMVSRSVTPLNFSSKKQLFFSLCYPPLIDGGKLSFNLEKSSGKKSYLLSARALSITWSNDPLYWDIWLNQGFQRLLCLEQPIGLKLKGRSKLECYHQTQSMEPISCDQNQE